MPCWRPPAGAKAENGSWEFDIPLAGPAHGTGAEPGLDGIQGPLDLFPGPIRPAAGGKQRRLHRPVCRHQVGRAHPHQAHRLPEAMLWGAGELKTVARAVVGVYGWHTDRIYPAMLERSPELFRFTLAAAVKSAERKLACQDFAKILCVPRLPVSEKLRNETFATLRRRGIDGVLSFRTMLLELLDSVEANKNYEKSDLLQVLRILKNYDLIKTSQQELFSRMRRRVRNLPASSAPGSR